MGARTFISTKDYIIGAATPVYPGKSYAVIPHVEIIDAAEGLLTQAGMMPDAVLFKTNMEANVVRCVYHLGGTDPDMEMMFAWVNSYDKTKRFQCVIGSKVRASGGYWLGGNMGSWTRKHTGNAKQEAIDAMAQQISNAGKYFSTMVTHKEEMKMVILPQRLRAELLGRILFEKGYITLEQASIVKTELMQPKDYGADKDSLWSTAQAINLSLNKSHPRDWMTRAINCSEFINKEFGIGVPKGDPNQVNLLDSIAEVEAEAAVTTNQSPEVPPEPQISFEL